MAEYIKRASVMTVCERYSQHCFEQNDSHGQDIADRIFDNIAELPAADVVEVKHSAWGHKYSLHKIVCLNCGTPRPYQKTKRGYHLAWDSNYCPNCGAKMDLKEGAEE